MKSQIRNLEMKQNNSRHLHLLCDVSELIALLTVSEDIENFLQRTVDMVARHMAADVCSIYLYDEESEELVLRATIGLNPVSIGNVRLKIGEGLVGITVAKLEPLNEGLASRHPGFKYFEEIGEEHFDSFLAVPISRGTEIIGVLAVQHRDSDYFDDVDVMVMRGIASQLAGAIGSARLLTESSLQKKDQTLELSEEQAVRFVEGKMAAGGQAFAPAIVFEKSHGWLLDEHQDEGDEESEHSLADFHRAVEATAEQLKAYQERFARRLPESAALIFSAHLMILKDARFYHEMKKKISESLRNSKLDYISRTESIKAAPFFWGAMIALGKDGYIFR